MSLNHKENLKEADRKRSLNFMRVNHSGEVAAQALYLGQAMVARDPNLSKILKKSALEEKDHLRWCKERIIALGGRTSYFNPLWAMGSFMIGTTAGLFSDKISLGFLAETEHQVMHHLDNHLNCLSINDLDSRAILTQMRQDEEDHAKTAMDEGGAPLPRPVQGFMRFTAKIMTSLSFYF
jgi:ubiquinone biosynthesis monooxygenase Coq7